MIEGTVFFTTSIAAPSATGLSTFLSPPKFTFLMRSGKQEKAEGVFYKAYEVLWIVELRDKLSKTNRRSFHFDIFLDLDILDRILQNKYVIDGLKD